MAGFRYAAPIAAAVCTLAHFANAGGLADIDHVVLFMQGNEASLKAETCLVQNRAFDHYFGTMAGVRGFKDANLQMNGNLPVWKQLTTPDLTTDSQYVAPWYLNYLGGNWSEATQCMSAGSNGWYQNHAAWNFGTNDHWAMNNTPWSIGFYKKEDVPTQWALADGWVVGDMYQESIVSSTNPNRVAWISGSINSPGSPQRPDQGGNPYIDNNETPGCEKGGINCYPLQWKTSGEYYEDAGVSWQVFQDADNFDDNPYAWFKQFQDAKKDSPLYNKGIKGLPLSSFYEQAASGTLPEVSYIVGPTQLSEHQPYSPHDGAWLQDKIAQAVINSPRYSKTALIISYDETGGWFDHVDPYRSPDGTPAEWIDDPWGQVGHTFIGPGFRLPFYIISPWTRNGGVYTEHADHSSQILFIEKWQAAKGKNVTTDEMVHWRREHMGDLVGAFDFENPDYTVPKLPFAAEPHRNSQGNYDGSSYCQSRYSTTRPPVPYKGDGVIGDLASVVESGFKPVRGQLTEGRFLVFETNGLALTNPGKCRADSNAALTRASEGHKRELQRWVIHAVELGGSAFTLQSVADGRFICQGGLMCKQRQDALVFETDYEPSKGYTLEPKGSGRYLNAGGEKELSFDGPLGHWEIFSVSY
ncbi:Non-hemolytic phospholipase C [Tolypocladium ophioglossoides CBS 100239]|uniref:Non-hemolytic phospholipase C n=1 Tax=Tolypocladium ophioglossoides (strain CBS 100239) TaxID=1163406 RepID=A0A0L0NCX7_TOLOC|nr:Non-hemolytic phospholipase C [Tolypocladium ophioglossoides CBS 100239]